MEDKFQFNIAGTTIPTITEQPVKSLGKVFDITLRDTTSIQSTCSELDGWLKSVDKFGLSGKLQLPFKSLEEEFKVSRTREVVQYRDSNNPKVVNAGIQVRTGRKWRAEDAVQ